jgi:hypothetical protein
MIDIACPLLKKLYDEALEDLYCDPVMNFEALRILREIEEAIRARAYNEGL